MNLLLALYVVVLLGVGILFGAQRRDEADYYAANRSLTAPALAGSLTATGIGASSLLISAALVARHGVGGLILEMGAASGLFLLGTLFAGKIRDCGAFTLAGLLEARCGRGIRRPAAALLGISEVLWFLLLAQAFRDLIPGTAWLYGCLAVLVLYTSFGGQWAVVGTDAIQVIVLFGGMALLAALGNPDVGMPTFSFPSEGMLLFTLGFASHITGPDIYSRILSARDGNTARNGAILAAGARILWAFILLLLFNGKPVHNTVMAVLQDAPPFVAVTLSLVIISALVSSMDTVLLSASTLIRHDLLRRPFSTGGARAATLVIGFLSLGMSLLPATLIHRFTLSYSFFVGAFFAPTILALSLPPGRWRSQPLLSGMTAGGIVSAAWNCWAGIFIGAIAAAAARQWRPNNATRMD